MIHGRIKARNHFTNLIFFATAMTAIGVQAKPAESVPGEYVVKLKDQVSATSFAYDLIDKKAFTTLGNKLGAQVKSSIPEDNIVVVRRPMIETESSAIKILMQNPMVEVAEPNYIYHAERTPNDPLLGNLWGMKNTGQMDSSNSAGVAGVDIGVEKAWDIETGSKDVIIAVIDTGVDYNHPDLKDNIWTNQAELNGKPGVDDDANGYVDDIHGFSFADATGKVTDNMDDHGHGSHCSGTIGARGNDGAGIVGVNWNTRIMGVKFLGADGGGTLEGAIKAIDYATKMGAKVLSNSWGGGSYSETLKQAIERAHAAGAIFIAAAGNEADNNDQGEHYPANYNVPNVLSVAAIDNKGELASFSNYGKKRVHLAAPGVNIYSSLPGGKYESWSGTSMATPHVSGMAGLLLSHEPNLTNVQIKERLVATVQPLASLRGKVISGGLANAYNALTNVQAPPDPNDPARWASQTLAISSAHPYKSKTKEEYVVEVAGANEMALYFSKFDTEKSYDKVSIFDKAGNKIGEMSGTNDDSYSPTISGSYVKIVFESDDSVEKNGFDLTKVFFR